MPDAIFEHPRLIGIYDALEPDRSDLDVYVALVEKFRCHRVLDLGCGTGTLALRLADRGFAVTGVDPAAGSLNVARAKPGAERVDWVHGDGTDVHLRGSLRAPEMDMVVMTGNVAQAISDPPDWEGTLRSVHAALRPNGRLVFETRVPGRRAWDDWNRAATFRTTLIDGVGAVDSWVEVTGVHGPLVSFRWTYIFAADGLTLSSDSTLCFRERDEVMAQLIEHGFAIDDVCDAPDRPGLEYVFIARRAH